MAGRNLTFHTSRTCFTTTTFKQTTTMGSYDAWIIMACSFCTALVSEAMSYMLIYRTDGYKLLKKNIDALKAKLEKQKNANTTIDRQKSKDKKISQVDAQLTDKNREMALFKMKSTLFVAVAMMGVYSFLGNIYNGEVVATLPFHPMPLMTGLSHRNLSGNDYTECSMTFVYMLCSFSIRGMVVRFFNQAPKSDDTPSLFAPPEGLDRTY